MNERSQRLHRLLLANFYLLLGLILVLVWVALPGAGLGRALIAVALIIPLMAPLPGLWRNSSRAVVWSCLLLTPYAAVALTEALANPQARPVALLAVVSGCAALALGFARLRARPPVRPPPRPPRPVPAPRRARKRD